MKKFIRPDILITALSLFFILLNLVLLCIQLPTYKKNGARNSPPGAAFTPFKENLAGQHTVGYLTQHGLTDKALATFLQAQYALAPIVIELDNTQARFIIIDGDDTAYITRALTTIPAKIVAHNAYGQGLIERAF